jgi:hypothetical protein
MSVHLDYIWISWCCQSLPGHFLASYAPLKPDYGDNKGKNGRSFSPKAPIPQSIKIIDNPFCILYNSQEYCSYISNLVATALADYRQGKITL